MVAFFYDSGDFAGELYSDYRTAGGIALVVYLVACVGLLPCSQSGLGIVCSLFYVFDLSSCSGEVSMLDADSSSTVGHGKCWLALAVWLRFYGCLALSTAVCIAAAFPRHSLLPPRSIPIRSRPRW